MRLVAILLFLGACSGPSEPPPPSKCEKLRARIDQILQNRGARHYDLQIQAAEPQPEGGRVLGMCAGGTKVIVYRRKA